MQFQNNSRKGIEFFYSKNPNHLKINKKRWGEISDYIRLNITLISLILSILISTICYSVYGVIFENISVNTQIVEACDDKHEVEVIEKTDTENDVWQIEIPVIGLIAPISEGTTQEVMKEYVGHFENTNMWTGNIGLAAHNRRISNKLFWKS